jgi:hypothetical protein
MGLAASHKPKGVGVEDVSMRTVTKGDKRGAPA